MTARILVPVDLSEISESLVACAASLARERGASLLLLHVVEPPSTEALGTPYFPTVVPDDPTVAARLRSLQAPADVACEHRLLHGMAAEQILRAARDEQPLMIVMGTHGRSGVSRLLMGSVAEMVLRHVDCPVLIMRDPSKFKAAGRTVQQQVAAS